MALYHPHSLGKAIYVFLLQLAKYGVFWANIFSKLSRKQTKQFKKLYHDFPNDYHFIPHNSTFDFLPETSQKQDPVALYELPFRMVRLEVEEGKYETLVTNTDYSVQELKNLYASRWGIETSFRDLKYSVGLVNFHAKKKEGFSKKSLLAL